MTSAEPIYFNGRFLLQNLTGVQRFAREIVVHLDRQIKDDPWASAQRWVLLTPPSTVEQLPLERFEQRPVGSGGGHLWEQTSLAYTARNGLLVGLANAGPVLHPRQLVVMHDAAVFRLPENYSWAYRLVHQSLSRRLGRSATLATVSNFSRGELAEILKCDPAAMTVVANAVAHERCAEPDPATLARLGLQDGGYFLVVGSNSRNKNIGAAVRSFQKAGLPDHQLVIVGDVKASVFGASTEFGGRGVIATGRLTDAELGALYRSATALVFPSLYEGFGIPPLEAMAHDCPVLASDIPPVREVCGLAAEYFQPLEEDDLTALLQRRAQNPGVRRTWQELGRARAAHFTWSASARTLMTLVQEMSMRRPRSLFWRAFRKPAPTFRNAL